MGKPKSSGPSQDLALSLAFEVMEKEQIKRSTEDYQRIAASLPPLKVLQFEVNARLRARRDEGRVPMAICEFHAGDIAILYRPYPKAISMEALRSGLELAGMRSPKGRRSRKSQRTQSSPANSESRA